MIEGLKNLVGFEGKQWTQQQKVNERTINYKDLWHELSRQPQAKDVLYWLRKFGYLNLRIQNFHPEWNCSQSKFNQISSDQIDVVAGLRQIQDTGFASFPFLVMECGNELKELFGFDVEKPEVVSRRFYKRRREKRRKERRRQEQQQSQQLQ